MNLNLTRKKNFLSHMVVLQNQEQKKQEPKVNTKLVPIDLTSSQSQNPSQVMVKRKNLDTNRPLRAFSDRVPSIDQNIYTPLLKIPGGIERYRPQQSKGPHKTLFGSESDSRFFLNGIFRRKSKIKPLSMITQPKKSPFQTEPQASAGNLVSSNNTSDEKDSPYRYPGQATISCPVKKVSKTQFEFSDSPPPITKSPPKQSKIQPHIRTVSNPSIVFTKEVEDIKQIRYFTQRSQAGQIGNKIKTNQDSLFCYPNIGQHKDWVYFGVSDGHGDHGHLVSQMVAKLLGNSLDMQLRGHLESELERKDRISVNQFLNGIFMKTQKEIVAFYPLETEYSGATCSSILVAGKNVWCANVGDSRSIMVYIKNNKWKFQQLSTDHKPNILTERNRIIKQKGVVQPLFGNDGQFHGPHRVWVANTSVPGLATSRSFGDKVAQSVGVISEPEVTYTNLLAKFTFIICASDGVWDMLSNERVSQILQEYWFEDMGQSNLDDAAIQIVKVDFKIKLKESTDKWMAKGSAVDDISVIIQFFRFEC